MPKRKPKHRPFPYKPVGVITAILALAVVVVLLVPPALPPPRPVTDICITAEKYHIHVLLRIVVSTFAQSFEAYSPPENVGILFDYPAGTGKVCMRPLHTHDASGVIHVEYEQPRDFTLKEFFDVWNVTFSMTKIWKWGIGEKGENNGTFTSIEFLAGIDPPFQPFDPYTMVLKNRLIINIRIS